MKAIIYDQYGPPEVLQQTEIETPVPKDNEVLIKTYATTVTSGDWRVRSLNVPSGFGLIIRLVFGISKPRQPILGTELAGVVESIGNDVSKFKVGDAAFVFSDAAMGCYVEYKCMPEDGPICLKPANLSYEAAAALSFGGTTALDFFRRSNLQPGDKVLINGASGSVGTAAVQLAKYFGAEVTGVCSSANAELVRSLGAHHTIDYRNEDFTANGERYDIIVDTVGTARFSRSRDSLTDNGRLLLVIAGLPDMLQGLWVSMMGNKKVIAGPVNTTVEDLQFLAALAEAGDFTPVIDRCYSFDQIVEAHRYVDRGHKVGNVIIRVCQDDEAS
jgi:NADPH:quinone reductase-like Zn-dependent oxidoreductase